jgi:hypothetical protein
MESAGVPDRLWHPADQPSRIGWKELFEGNPVPSVAPLFRRAVLDPLPPWYFELPWGDWPLYFLAAYQGELHYLPDVLAAHRVHMGGMYSGSSLLERREGDVRFFRGLSGALRDEHEVLRRRQLAQALARLAVIHLQRGQRRAAKACMDESYRAWAPPPWQWRSGQGDRTRLTLWARTRLPFLPSAPARSNRDEGELVGPWA